MKVIKRLQIGYRHTQHEIDFEMHPWSRCASMCLTHETAPVLPPAFLKGYDESKVEEALSLGSLLVLWTMPCDFWKVDR